MIRINSSASFRLLAIAFTLLLFSYNPVLFADDPIPPEHDWSVHNDDDLSDTLGTGNGSTIIEVANLQSSERAVEVRYTQDGKNHRHNIDPGDNIGFTPDSGTNYSVNADGDPTCKWAYGTRIYVQPT